MGMATSVSTRVRLDRELSAGGESFSGFNCRATLDDSPEELRRTKLAVDRAKGGDEEAFRYLYVRYSHNIYGYVRSIVRDDYEAEDVTQHVFAKLLTVLVKYDDRGVPFFAWLLRLSRNVAIDHLRANRMLPSDMVQDPDTQCATDLDRAMIVRTALEALPEDQRKVIVMRHLVGLSPGEIAQQMSKTESSIHGLHHRGRHALQREFELLEATPFTHDKRELAVA
jgi:RNA polymerase sigma-70 factor, ECF subfamily